MNWAKRFLLTYLLAFIPVLGDAQTLVNCAPATPCTMSGPLNTGIGDRAWLSFGKINTNFLQLYPAVGTTPQMKGAVGDGVADDTTPVQNCANTKVCLLPAGSYKVSSTVDVPAGGTFVGQGPGISIIVGNAVSGPIVRSGVPIAGITNWHNRVTIGNFQIAGTGKIGLSASIYNSNIFNIWASGTFTFNAFNFDITFSSTISNLNADNANIGSTLTFSGSVGGATSGTISSGTSPGNGIYIMVFPNGEIRAVTISGSTASWATALKAGTVNTVAYGAGFFFGGGINGDGISGLVTQSSEMPFNFIFDDVNSIGNSNASSFNGLIAQNGQVGYFFGQGHSNHVLSGIYTEDVVTPIVYGLVDGSRHPQSIAINGASLASSLASHSKYASRYTWIDLQYGRGLKITNPRFFVGDGSSTVAYPLTFSGGTATFPAVAYAFANAAGVIKGVAIIYGGSYSVVPTGCSYTGGNPGTGATFSLTTGTIPIRGDQGVLTITVTAGGSGYTASTGMVPVLINQAQMVSIDTPSYGWGLAKSSWGGISPIMAYSSINPSADASIGITITGEIGQYTTSGSGTHNAPDMTVYKAFEYTYQEWVEYAGASGVKAKYAVPMVAFP